MNTQSVRARITAELEDASASRREGREGRARVCARRAAGLAASAYYESRHVGSVPQSAYDLLKLVQQEAGVPEETRLAAARLATRVTIAGRLPHPQDPLEDARLLIGVLLAAADRSAFESRPSRIEPRGQGED